MNKCKACRHFQWKLDVDSGLWGNCLHPNFYDNHRLSMTKVSEIFEHPNHHKLINGMKKYCRIQVEENYGCIFWEAED